MDLLDRSEGHPDPPIVVIDLEDFLHTEISLLRFALRESLKPSHLGKGILGLWMTFIGHVLSQRVGIYFVSV